MVNSEPLPKGHRIASGYHGTEVQPQYRGVEACQNLLNKEIKVGTFDDLIVNQLENAKKQDRSKITILDIGSGQGNLFRDFLSNASLGQKTREFLSQNSDFTIEMIGVTDAKSVDELLEKKEITADALNSPDNSQIKALNIKYTLSYNQRIGDILKANNIDGIDLCVSTVAFTYLGPGTFENAVTDVIDNLHSGGQMVAYDYSGIAPGIIQPDPMFLSLDIRNIPDVKNETSLKATLHEQSIRFSRRGLNIEEEEKALEKAEDLMVKVNAVKQDEIDKRRKEFLSDPDYDRDRGIALGRRATYLSRDEYNLIKNHISKLRQIKNRQLESIFNSYQSQIEGDYKEATLFIKKI